MIIIIFLITAWDYSYDISAGITYDDNIFSYSPEYIDDFINQIRPYRFPFETHDDLKSSVDLILLLRNKFFSKKITTFNINLGLHQYLENSQKDFLKTGIGIRQSFGKIAFKVSYDIIPSYLIRYYKNPQAETTEYVGCALKYQIIRGKLSFKPNSTFSCALRYSRKCDDYISEFNIYDAQSHIIGLTSNFNVTKRMELMLGYEFKILNMDSTEDIETGNEPVPDGAYNQHSIRGGLGFKFKFLTLTKLKLSYNYIFRNYTTDFSSDAMHYGRQDHKHHISIGAQWQVFTGMLIDVSYSRQCRTATSSIHLDLNSIKGFNKYRFSIGLNFYH